MDNQCEKTLITILGTMSGITLRRNCENGHGQGNHRCTGGMECHSKQETDVTDKNAQNARWIWPNARASAEHFRGAQGVIRVDIHNSINKIQDLSNSPPELVSS
jgi:hypothetical protein